MFLILGNEIPEPVIDRYFDYLARAEVAKKHNLMDLAKTDESNAIKVIADWANKLSIETFHFISKDFEGDIRGDHTGSTIKEKIASKLFPKGFDGLRGIVDNLWKEKDAKRTAEVILSAHNLTDLEKLSGGSKVVREILRDEQSRHIADGNLVIEPSADVNHPLIQAIREIDPHMKGSLNLGKSLRFLNRPPYGYYPSEVHYAALAMCLRPYVNKLHQAGTGKPINATAMRDAIYDVFKSWEGTNRPNLEMRIGSPDEEKLAKIIADVFQFTDASDLRICQAKIRDWIQKSHYPLWVFGYQEGIGPSVPIAIEAILEFLTKTDTDFFEGYIKSLNTDVLADVQLDLKTLLKKENAEHLFQRWLATNADLEYNPDEFEDLIGFVRKSLPEEKSVDLWKKDEVANCLYRWQSKRNGMKQQGAMIQDLSRLFGLFGTKSITSLAEFQNDIEQWEDDKGLNLICFQKGTTQQSLHDLVDGLQAIRAAKALDEVSEETVRKARQVQDSLNREQREYFSKRENGEKGLKQWVKDTFRGDISESELEAVCAFVKTEWSPKAWTDTNLSESIRQWVQKRRREDNEQCAIRWLSKGFGCEFTSDSAISILKSWADETGYPVWVYGLASVTPETANLLGLAEKLLQEDLSLEEVGAEIGNEEFNRLTPIRECGDPAALLLNWIKTTLQETGEVSAFVEAIHSAWRDHPEIRTKDKSEIFLSRKQRDINQAKPTVKVVREPANPAPKGTKRSAKSIPREDAYDVLCRLAEAHPEIEDWLGEVQV
jgi:hypothetical protein